MQQVLQLHFILCFAAEPSLTSCLHSGSSPWWLESDWLTWATGRSPPPWCCWPCTEATCAPWGATATWRGRSSWSWRQKTRTLKSSRTDDGCMSVSVRLRHGRLFFFSYCLCASTITDLMEIFVLQGMLDERYELQDQWDKHQLYVLLYIKCLWAHNTSNCILKKKKAKFHLGAGVLTTVYIWKYISTRDSPENRI